MLINWSRCHLISSYIQAVWSILSLGEKNWDWVWIWQKWTLQTPIYTKWQKHGNNIRVSKWTGLWSLPSASQGMLWGWWQRGHVMPNPNDEWVSKAEQSRAKTGGISKTLRQISAWRTFQQDWLTRYNPTRGRPGWT